MQEEPHRVRQYLKAVVDHPARVVKASDLSTVKVNLFNAVVVVQVRNANFGAGILNGLCAQSSSSEPKYKKNMCYSHTVKIREFKKLSQFLTINCMLNQSLPHICIRNQARLHTKPPKTLSINAWGFFVYMRFKCI